MIPDETVERVREAADIVAIIGEHVRLRRSGGDWRGPCPFHQGKNPNFSVSPRRNAYHCFKCGVSGDVFTFVREHLGLDFVESVKYVGAQAGVEVREVTTRREERDHREPLWEAVAAAAELFARTLWTDEGAAAQHYLEERGITREVAEGFGLGFAPHEPTALRRHLAGLGHDVDRQLAAGLLVRREGETDARPRFRGRLTIPIQETGGRHVGFGARVIGDGEPKYLNSPQSEIFDKGRLLYGLQWARSAIRKSERALVVEGYFDAMRLAHAGIEEAVAPLGTALTEAQAGLLARYSKNVFLLYDSDEAGQKATFRAGLELLRHGVAVRVVSMPDGDDPDTFVARHGRDRLEEQLAQAMDLFDRQVQILERRGWFADLHRTRRAVDKLLPTVRAASDPVTRELYLARLADASRVDRRVLERELEATPRPRAVAGGAAPLQEAAPPAFAEYAPRESRGGARRREFGRRRGGRRQDDEPYSAPGVERLTSREPSAAWERTLVLAMLHVPAQAAAISAQVPMERLRSPIYAELFAVIAEHGGGETAEKLAAIAAELSSEEAVRELERLAERRAELGDPARTVRDTLDTLRLRDLREELREIQKLLEQAPTEERKNELIRQKETRQKEREALVRRSRT
ncbi:MAG TPA: DNA primase [Gemmatimonadaceae bacterium]|nr:DNA primase [Gemmatimonadaceae bacterium]